MPGSAPNPRVRTAIETMIRVAGPGLDLLLAAADRISRVLVRGDGGYAVVRLEHQGESAPRGLERPGAGPPGSKGPT